VDESGMFVNQLPNDNELSFRYQPAKFEEIRKKIGGKNGLQYVLHIPDTFNIFKPENIRLITSKNVGVGLNSRLESIVANRVRDLRIEELNLNKSLIDTLKTSVNIQVREHTLEGEKESSSAAASGA